jgi:hypothetical protein
MIPLHANDTSGLAVHDKLCFNCKGKMISQGVKNGLYIYQCTACNNIFEVYEPK